MKLYHGSNVKIDIPDLSNSETFARLQNADTGMFYQSPGYVYSFLANELNFCDYRK